MNAVLKRKDTTPRVNPQLAVELVYQELKRVKSIRSA